jgi:hypothetical protein
LLLIGTEDLQPNASFQQALASLTSAPRALNEIVHLRRTRYGITHASLPASDRRAFR